MRVRKIAKQLKRWYNSYEGWDKENEKPIYSYRISQYNQKVRHIIRMSRRYYLSLAKKCEPNSMMAKLYIHNACSPYLYDEILIHWNIDADRC